MGFFEKLNLWFTNKKVLVILFLLGFITYGNSIPNGFVWDDEEQIVKNVIIQDFGNISQIFSGATFSTGGAGLSGYFFRPFITLTFMINYFFWGENAFGFHLFQVFFHILNAFLIYLIFTRLTLIFKTHPQKLISFVLASIYTVHPAITEGVVYIAAVSEVMFTFFILMAFYLVLKIDDKKPTTKNLIWISSLLFGACLFKEPAVVGPPILIAYTLLFLRKHRLRWILTFIGVLLFYFFIRLIVVQTPIKHPLYSLISEASFYERLLTIPQVIFHYLTIIFYPQHLAISQHFIVKNPDLYNFLIPLSITLTVFLSVSIYGFRTRNKLILFALCWLVISAGPILNIIPLDMTVAERWLYFPFIGFLLLTLGVILSIKNQTISKTLFILLLVSIITLSIRTIIRNMDWKDGLTLYTHDAKINPESFDLQNNLGVELFRIGKFSESKVHFEKSLSLQPKWHFALNNLGAVYQRENNLEKAKQQYLKVLKTSDYYLAHENLSSIYLMEKNYQEAKEFTEKSLSKLPNNPILWQNLTIAEYHLGNKERALQAAANAFNLNPNDQTAYLYYNLQQGNELKFE